MEFTPVEFVPDAPSDGKWAGEAVSGVRFQATDPDMYDPTVAALAVLIESRALAGQRWEWNVAHFDRLSGTDRLRLGIDAGWEVERLSASWESAAAGFEASAAPYLMYAR